MSMEKPLTGKIPRERIGALELPRLPAELLAAFRSPASAPAKAA